MKSNEIGISNKSTALNWKWKLNFVSKYVYQSGELKTIKLPQKNFKYKRNWHNCKYFDWNLPAKVNFNHFQSHKFICDSMHTNFN